MATPPEHTTNVVDPEKAPAYAVPHDADPEKAPAYDVPPEGSVDPNQGKLHQNLQGRHMQMIAM